MFYQYYHNSVKKILKKNIKKTTSDLSTAYTQEETHGTISPSTHLMYVCGESPNLHLDRQYWVGIVGS